MRTESVPRRGRARRQLAVAALVPVLLASCTAGPSTRPPVVENDGPPPSAPGGTSQQVPLPDLDESRNSSISWSRCDASVLSTLDDRVLTRFEDRLGKKGAPTRPSLSCARITTTLDPPSLPGRGLTRLALLKVGDGPVPLAVVNDVDGLPGTHYAVELAATLPTELLDTFSLVGVDRRGTGASDPARCIPLETRETLLGHDPTTTVGPLLDAARVAGQQCAIDLKDAQTALDSWHAAGDLETLREKLEVEHLNVLGRGEGSTTVAHYAARYPNRVGRVVLDGVPDPSPDMATVLDGVAAGAEAALDEFAADCARRGDCPLSDARAAVTALSDQARATPLRTGAGYSMGPALVLRAVFTGLAQPQRWPELADAVAAARQGDGDPLAEFVDPLLVDTDVSTARLDGSLATRCNDATTRLPADQLRQVSRDLGTEHPVFGAVVAQRIAWCSPWPSRQQPSPEFGSRDAPPILVVSTAVDPVTPEKGTIRAVEQIPSAVRVAWQGTGHGGLGSPCVGRAVRGFLVDGMVPRDGTLCPA